MTGSDSTPKSEEKSDVSSEFEHVSLDEGQAGSKPVEKQEGRSGAKPSSTAATEQPPKQLSPSQQQAPPPVPAATPEPVAASSSQADEAKEDASAASPADPSEVPTNDVAQDPAQDPVEEPITGLDPTVDLAIFGMDELGLPSSYKQGDASAIDGLAREAMKDLEDVGSKVAALASTAVHDVQKVRLWFIRLLTYGRRLTDAELWSSTEPNSGLTQLSSGLKGWFGSLTGPATEQPAAAAEPPPPVKPTRSLASLQEFFQLPVDENILESFTCSLQQQLQCSHNGYTPNLQMVFPGILCITDIHLCFVGDDAAAVPPFKLPHKGVKKVSSPRPRKGQKDVVRVLRIDCSDGTYLVLREFEGGTNQLDDALALIELKLEDV